MSLSARAPRTGDPFWDLLVRDAHAWGIDPRDLAAVMMVESVGIDPNALHPGGAVGLNQIINYKIFAPLSRDQYRALDAATQWEAGARKYFDNVISDHPAVRRGGARDLYWLNFVPATYKPGAPDDYAIIRPGVNYGTTADPLTGDTIIKSNSSFVLPEDADDPVIRPAGLIRAMQAAINGNAARWKEVLNAISNAERVAGIAPGSASTAPRSTQTSLFLPLLALGALGTFAWIKARR